MGNAGSSLLQRSVCGLKSLAVELNGHSLPFKAELNRNDQHVRMRFQLRDARNSLVIRTRKDFGLAMANELPPLGSASRGLRVISESWNATKNQLAIDLSGLGGHKYEMGVWNPSQVTSVDGAALTSGKLQIEMPQAGGDSYVPRK